MMDTTAEMHAKKSERTLRTAMLLSAPGPLIIAITALGSGSATQIADFLRRTSELTASFVSWLLFRMLNRQKTPDAAFRARSERIANLVVALAMLLSGIALCAVGILRLQSEDVTAKPVSGLVIALLGLLANSIFFFRYRSLSKERHDPILTAQQRLYQAKVTVDVCVSSALLAVVIAPTHPATRYIDALGSIVVAAYLVFCAIRMMRKMRKES